MALTVRYLASYPQFGFNGVPTQVNASSFTYTNGVDNSTYTGKVAGYIDGEARAKLFLTDGTSVQLPNLVSVTRISQVDAAGTTKTGGFVIQLGSWDKNSPDTSSANSEIFLDEMGLLLVASTNFG